MTAATPTLPLLASPIDTAWRSLSSCDEVAAKGGPIRPQTILSDARREIIVEPLLPGRDRAARLAGTDM
jgi:hypothetical protein